MMMNKLILIESVDFSTDFDSASTDIEKQNVINDFLKALYIEYGVNFDDGAKSYLQTFLLGLSGQYFRDTNPLIQFFIRFHKFNPSIIITKPICETIINLFGDGVITENNLLAKSSVGVEDIIFVNDLYNQDYNSAKYLCQVYYWLHKKSNIESLHLEQLFENDAILEEFCNKLVISYPTLISLFKFSKDKQGRWRDAKGRWVRESDVFKNYDPHNLACIFCFVNIVFDYNGKLRKAQVIEQTMDYIDAVQADVGITSDQTSSNKLRDVINSISTMPEEDIAIVKTYINKK